MQSQLVCSGCRNILLYPRGATNVCCAVCNAITSVPPPGMCHSLHSYEYASEDISNGFLLLNPQKVDFTILRKFSDKGGEELIGVAFLRTSAIPQ